MHPRFFRPGVLYHFYWKKNVLSRIDIGHTENTHRNERWIDWNETIFFLEKSSCFFSLNIYIYIVDIVAYNFKYGVDIVGPKWNHNNVLTIYKQRDDKLYYKIQMEFPSIAITHEQKSKEMKKSTE